MSNNSNNFRYNTPFKSDINLRGLKFGFDKPLLETEVNELQAIQNELRDSVIRNIVPSGFLELVSKNFNGPSIIYNPTDTFNSLLNHIAIAPAKAIVNGIIINIYGTYAADHGDGYTLIDIGDPPTSGVREDLVYLEVWIERVDSSDKFPQQGYINGITSNYKAVDSRVGDETSRRIVVRYNIRVAHDIDFNAFSDGLGYLNTNSLSPIYAEANGTLQDAFNAHLLFRNASDDIFKECSFYKDYNLYVAGRPDYTLVSSTNSLAGKYIYALPLFHISRKNTQPYSLDNFNGARTSIFKYGDVTSVASGDLLGNIRPDKICYDVISPSDVIDLRKSVVLDVHSEYYLNRALKQLMTGQLQTRKPATMRRVQFGRQNITVSSSNNAILHTTFDDQSLISEDLGNGTSGVITSNEDNFEPVYRDSVSGYGLYIDGRFSVRYDISALSAISGTIDFFMEPYWDGATDIIQNIFKVDDINGNPVFVMYKNGYQLIVDVYLSASSATASAQIRQMVVDLTEQLIFAKQIYHIRFSWNATPAIAKVFTYINGNVVGQLDYSGTSLIPNSIVFGNETDASIYAGLELSEEIEEDDDEPIEEDNSYVQIALPGESNLVLGEMFLTDDNRPIYTDTNLYVFINEEDLSEDENNPTWLSEHTTLSSSIYNDMSSSEEDANNTDSNDSIGSSADAEVNTTYPVIVRLPLYEMALSELEIISGSEEEKDTELINFIKPINAYWDNYNITSENDSEEESSESASDASSSSNTDNVSDIEANYAPEIISRFVSTDALSSEEIDTIRAREARKELDIAEEQYELEQAAYENWKALNNVRSMMLENINYGFILEELIIYKDSKEVIVNDGVYSYTSNSYWPGIPNDFIANKALIYPSFNSLYRGYSDNNLIQNRTVKLLEGSSGVFTVKAPYKGEIVNEPIIFHANGQINSEGELVTLPGSWRKIKDDWVFNALDTSLVEATVMYNITIPKGMGGEDLPNEILAAAYVNASNVLEEVSFHRMGVTTAREITYFNPSRVSAEVDRAYDFSMTRARTAAYARLLFYHLSGVGTNVFEIPSHLYGYPVLNIISATNRNIANIQYIPDDDSNPYYGFINSAGTFVVTLEDRVPYGDLVEFEIALGGTTFDYETQTKTLITNIYRTVLASVTADGNRSTFIIPLGSDTGGIIHAANSITINHFDDNGLLTSQESKFAAYVDNCLYPYRPIQNARGIDTNTWANQLAEIEIEPTSWSTPFLKFSMTYTPAEGSIITVPVLVSYQPPRERVISIWYNYVPYQGILGKNTKRLKRLTDWKYFITTLSSGRDTILLDADNVNSLNNIINRLPGGRSYASLVTGSKIIFGTDLTNLDFIYSRIRKNLDDDGFRKQAVFVSDTGELNIDITTNDNYNIAINPAQSKTVGSDIIGTFDDIEPYLKADANYELRFIKDIVFSSEANDFDNAFFELDTSLDVYKITRGFQDERLNYSFNPFKTYLPDTVYAICKYAGMACLVQDEKGQILLFVIGCLNNGEITQFASAETIITPMFGDLFYLEGRPTALLR